VKEYESFLELGIAEEIDDRVVTDIGRHIKRSYGNVCYCDSILGRKAAGWTVGVTDRYVDEVDELARKFPDVTFVAKILDNDSLRIEFIRENRSAVREYRLDPEIPKSGCWTAATDEYGEE